MEMRVKMLNLEMESLYLLNICNQNFHLLIDGLQYHPS
jgi:hypothetical protein